MTEHTPLPWRVFKSKDGTKLVGIGGQDGEGILDAGFGVWSWNDPEGIANAELVVSSVNSLPALVKALENISAIENRESGPDWEEIDEAREIADKALAAYRTATHD